MGSSQQSLFVSDWWLNEWCSIDKGLMAPDVTLNIPNQPSYNKWYITDESCTIHQFVHSIANDGMIQLNLYRFTHRIYIVHVKWDCNLSECILYIINFIYSTSQINHDLIRIQVIVYTKGFVTYPFVTYSFELNFIIAIMDHTFNHCSDKIKVIRASRRPPDGQMISRDDFVSTHKHTDHRILNQMLINNIMSTLV
eukprot:43525_1